MFGLWKSKKMTSRLRICSWVCRLIDFLYLIMRLMVSKKTAAKTLFWLRCAVEWSWWMMLPETAWMSCQSCG